MEQQKKPGGLERFYIACFKPSRYKEILDAGKGTHILYFAFVVLLMVFIEAVLPFLAWDVSVGGLKGVITERIPAFTVEGGKMTIAEPIEFDISGIVHVKADSNIEKYSKDDFDSKYQEELLFSNTNLMLKMGDRVMDLPMSEVVEGTMDNQGLVQAIPFFRMMLGVYFLSTYLVKAGEYVIAAVFFAILCRAAIRTPDGRFVNLKGTIVISIYAKTLFSLIRSVHTCLGSPLTDTVVLVIGTCGTILFIDRAEAAVLNIKPRLKR